MYPREQMHLALFWENSALIEPEVSRVHQD